MTIYAGEIIEDIAYVFGATGDPSLLDAGVVFSSTQFLRPDGTTGTPTIANTDEVGAYRVTFPTLANLPGTYGFSGFSMETGDEYVATYDVDSPVASDITGATGQTLYEYMLQIADELADRLELTATSDATGPNVIIDANNLLGGDGELRSSFGIVRTSATLANVGQVVRISGNSSVTTAATFAPNLPAPLLEGDVMDLLDLGGFGFRPQVYRQHIKNAVLKSYPAHLIEISAESDPDRFSAASPTIPIPAEFVAVFGVFFMEADDPTLWRDVRPARSRGRWGEGWSLDRPNRAIRIDGCGWQDVMDGTLYVIGGYARHVVPNEDTDVITVPPQWLFLEVMSSLAGRRVGERRWNDWAVEWGRRADAERANVWTPRHADTQFIGA